MKNVNVLIKKNYRLFRKTIKSKIKEAMKNGRKSIIIEVKKEDLPNTIIEELRKAEYIVEFCGSETCIKC